METEIRILLVDDDAADLQQTLEALRRRCLGRAVHTARGGQEALDYLFGRGHFEARRRIPVAALCTSRCEGERAMGCEFHVNGYVVKPVIFESLASLSQRIENWTLRLDLPPRSYTDIPKSPVTFNSAYAA